MNADDINSSRQDIQSGKGSSFGYNIKLKKLKIAQATALTKNRKKKVLDNAEELSGQVDARIKSVALNKFAIRKAKTLKDLGKTKSEIQFIVNELLSANDSIVSRAKTTLSGFGIDQKYIGLSAEEILEKINAYTKSKKEKKSGSTNSAKQTTTKKSTVSGNTIINNITVNNESGVVPGSSSKTAAGVKHSPLKVKTNPDVDTKDDIEQNNEKIYNYLMKSGEIDIANYILDLMTTPDVKKQLNVSDIQANTKELSRLSGINKEIHLKLEELEEGLRDEQDTSISIQQKLEEQIKTEKSVSAPEKKKGTGFLAALLRMLLGNSIVDMFISAGSVYGLAKILLKTGWKWISKRVTSLVSPMIGAVKTWAATQLANLKNIVADLGKALWSKISPAAAAGWNKIKDKLGLGVTKAKDVIKGVKTKAGAAKAAASTKAVSKMSKVTNQIKQSKAVTKVTKAARLSGSKIGKVVPKGLLKKLLKFTKPIPFLGTALAAGTAIYSAQDGYRNADKILGKDPKELTTLDKLASAAGALVNDVSFGVLSTKGTAEKIIGWTKKDDIDNAVKRYEEEGVIEHNRFGNSEILDWTKLGALPSDEIKKLIDFDDWSKKDSKKMLDLYIKRKEYETSAKEWKASVPVKFEAEINPNEDYRPINYTMKTIPKVPNIPMVNGEGGEVPSKNPSDYKISDLFQKHTVTDDDIENLHPAVLHNLKAMAAEYLDTYGEKIQINSAFRSFEEQARMKKKYGSKAAAPGSSMHNYGVAVDMNTSNANKAIAAGLFTKYGFHRPVRGESWHVEPTKINREEIRSSGMAAYSDAAKYASTTPTESMTSESEGVIPDKANIAVPMDMSIPKSKESVEIENQITNIKSTIEVLKNKKTLAERSGDTKSVKTIEKWITDYETKISNIQNNISGSVLGKEDAYKDRQMQQTEQSYRNGLANTKAFHRTTSPMQASTTNINSVNGVPNTRAPKPSEMFNM